MRNDAALKDQWLCALGDAIAERRLNINMTQQELADNSSVHRTYISDIERGTRNVTVTTANKIAFALGIPSSKLFAIADKKMANMSIRKKSSR